MGQTLYDYCHEYGKTYLLEEWEQERNAPLTPEAVTSGSSRYVFWRCEHNHAWRADIYSRAKKDTRCPYCTGKRVQPGVNDLATLDPYLAAQWHPVKNGDLTPEQVTVGTHRLVWWQCGHGHVWRAAVNSRRSGAGCPVCAGRKVLPGVNDLAAAAPDLAAQWHPTKNGSLYPADVVCGTRRKVWWQCEKGHEWRAMVSSRMRSGTGCPVCAGKRVLPGINDLTMVFPEIAAQWDREKNGALTPEQVSPYSNRPVWWRCTLGHSYRTSVGARTNSGSGCPYCAGRKVLPGFNDLATLAPEIAAQWHPTLNGSLTPAMVTAGSHRKAWWECPAGHVWKAAVYSRGRQKTGCPVCAGRVKPSRLQKPGLAGTELSRQDLNKPFGF